MSLLSTLVACCGANDCGSSTAKKDRKSTLIVVGGHGGDIGKKSGRQAVQWRPSLCTISEEDVIKTELIQPYEVLCNKGKKNRRMRWRHEFKPKEYVLRDSWDMVSPFPSSFLF
ncbi:hypothetical protein SSX86_027453 [Deinandra increscens subsp. villosa]|uniref:Uncharacterized protein n=1 Tax=Deinandra increscens subsp. villosa TaxID=3103831 RepID=A0AAP0CN57_9ASTR